MQHYTAPTTLADAVRVLDRAIDHFGHDRAVRHGFTSPHSWRGIYAMPSFAHSPATLGEMRRSVSRSLTETFEGWKGGDYRYDDGSIAHLDYEGECYDTEDGERFTEQLMLMLLELYLDEEG